MFPIRDGCREIEEREKFLREDKQQDESDDEADRIAEISHQFFLADDMLLFPQEIGDDRTDCQHEADFDE